MTKIEQAYLNGFIKAANEIGPAAQELLNKFLNRGGVTPGTELMRVQRGFTGPKGIASDTLNNAKHGFGLGSLTDNRFVNFAKKNPATSLGLMAGGGLAAAKGGTAAGNLFGPAQDVDILKDQGKAQSAYDQVHQPPDQYSLPNIFQQIKGNISDHPYWWGGGLAAAGGLGGLGYYMHKHPFKQHGPDMSDEPGGPEDLEQ